MSEIKTKLLSRSDLIHLIDRCHVITGLAHSTICQFAIGNSKTYQALVDGRPGPGIDGIHKICEWCEEQISAAMRAHLADTGEQPPQEDTAA